MPATIGYVPWQPTAIFIAMALSTLGAAGCIPHGLAQSRSDSNTANVTDPGRLPHAENGDADDSRHDERKDAEPRDLAVRIRQLQLGIEAKKAELQLMEKRLSDMKQLQAAERKISRKPRPAEHPAGGRTPKHDVTTDKQSATRVLPPLLPEPVLPAEQLIEAKLDDIDRILGQLRRAQRGAEADELEKRVTDVRNRLRDKEADFKPLGQQGELHVVGLYEGTEFELGRQRAEVHVTYTQAPVMLCLTAYEKIHWTVKVAKDAKLDSIILGGRIQFLVDPPKGVEIVDCTAENSGTRPLGSAYTRFSSDSSGSQFPSLAKQLKDITGLEVATFQGAYRYPNKPIVVGPESEEWRRERVLAELRPIHVEATKPERLRDWHRMKDLRFTAVHYRFAPGGNRRFMRHHEATGSLGPFTPLGPDLNKHKPFPANVSCPVHDSNEGQYYAIAGHGLVQLNQRGGEHTNLEPPKDFPDVSWPCGLAFDSKRRKVVMVSLGGTGYMYGYEPAIRKWTLMADMKGAGLVPFVYLPDQDQFVGLQVEHGARNQLYRYDHQGKLLGKTPLSQSLLAHGAKHGHCQAVPVGEYVVFLIGAEHTTRDGDRVVRAFVVEPDTGKVVFSILHDDETLRAAAAAEIPEAPEWGDTVSRTSNVEANVTTGRPGIANRSPEAVLADLRKKAEKGIDHAPELHVVGFYEPGRRFDREPGQVGSVSVCIKPSQKPMVVALTAYESTHWKVALEPDANVAAVILSGYHSHRVEGVPADVPLIKMSYDDGSRNYFYGYDEKDRDFHEMLDRARKVTGLEVLTFQGSYTPLAGTVYRIRPAVPGDYKAVRARLTEKE